LGMAIIILSVGLLVISCGGGSSHKDFHGTWEGSSRTLNISSKEIIRHYLDNITTLRIESVTPLENTEPSKTNYPRGFRFDIIEILSDGSTGSKFSYHLYMHTGKKELLWALSDRDIILKKQ